jgi:hypothetical protein
MEKFSQKLIPFGPVVLEKKTEMHKFPLGE